jgi:hypothetical protein
MLDETGAAYGLILPEGVQLLPGTFAGLRGRTRGSGGGYLMPEGVRYTSGKYVNSWYCHGYKTEGEHYHFNEAHKRQCQREMGEEVSYAE